MTERLKRIESIFGSTRGLVLLGTLATALAMAFAGLVASPFGLPGLRAWMTANLGLEILPQGREARIVILYHVITMAVLTIEVYFLTALVPMKKDLGQMVNATITVGYLLSMVFGLAFAYFGSNYVFHGLFIFGQGLIFFAGLVLSYGLWPWSDEYRVESGGKKRVDLERVACFLMAVATLGSAIFGAVPGSLYGNGFKTFLSEDVVRLPTKTSLEYAIIGHLHIMLTLMAVALFLILSRWLGFKGKGHKPAMILMIIGTIIITGGVWAVVPFPAVAHIIINVGSMPVLAASVIMAIWGWRTYGARDPFRFGSLWQMIYMNLVVTAVGIFMAVRLDAIIRTWPALEERIALVGHWHVLLGIIMTILALVTADLAGLSGRSRKLFGWTVMVGSDLAFAAVALLEIKRLFVDQLHQQPLVDVLMVLVALGLGLAAVALVAFLVWCLADFIKKAGHWSERSPVWPDFNAYTKKEARK